MRILIFGILVLVLMLNTVSAVLATEATTKAPTAATAEAKFAMVCSKCHGPTGRGMASFPRLSDKTKSHLVKRLKQYRAGEKVGPNTPLMAPHATKLTDAEIESFATYISTVLSTK